jgi:hypothetical protein
VTRAGRAAGQLSLLAPGAPTTTHEHPVLRVVIPCSKWKAASEAPASRHDLDERRAHTHDRLAARAQPARELYAGRAYLRALAAVDRFAERRPDLPIALHIASAGYGIVDAQELLVPYEALMGSGVRQWTARGQFLGMAQKALSLIESCDLTILALSQPYFIAAAVATIEPANGSGVVIGVGHAPRSPRLRTVIASRPQARGLGTTEREVASVVLGRLLDQIATHGLDVVHELSIDPLGWPAS